MFCNADSGRCTIWKFYSRGFLNGGRPANEGKFHMLIQFFEISFSRHIIEAWQNLLPPIPQLQLNCLFSFGLIDFLELVLFQFLFLVFLYFSDPDVIFACLSIMFKIACD